MPVDYPFPFRRTGTRTIDTFRHLSNDTVTFELWQYITFTIYHNMRIISDFLHELYIIINANFQFPSYDISIGS